MNSTFLLIISFVVSFVLSWALGYLLIPALHKLKFGQSILTDIGPRWHKKKQGTPTMGGLLFIISVLVASLTAFLVSKAAGVNVFSTLAEQAAGEKMKVFGGLAMAVMFAAIGFTDDFIKVKRHRNLGLTEMQKTIPQVLVSAAYLVGMYMVNGSGMYIPFYGMLDLKWFYFIFGLCVIYGSVNAVNFTDGIDGLCSSVTITCSLAFTLAAVLYKFTSVGILGAAVCAGCAGYLIWNRFPAKVMMGDTGSMFLGGVVAALAYAIDMPIILLLFGFIYVVEALSDIIQIFSVRFLHKKVFKMAPIHHHCEMSGWRETKIVPVFSLINAVACAAGLALIYFGDKRVF